MTTYYKIRIMELGFIIEYNNKTKRGFAKFNNFSYYEKFYYYFFDLNHTEVPYNLFSGDIIRFNELHYQDSRGLVTEIYVKKGDDKYKAPNAGLRYFVELAISKSIDNMLNFIYRNFDMLGYQDHNLFAHIDENIKKNMIMAYLHDDIYTGDHLLKTIVDSYVDCLNIKTLVEENLIVKYEIDKKSRSYGGRDYDECNFSLDYKSHFNCNNDVYLEYLYTIYEHNLVYESIDGKYISHSPDVVEYISEHKDEMDSHCEYKTRELRDEIITNYNFFQHSKFLYSHFRRKISELLAYLSEAKEHSEKIWQYSVTLDFFKQFKLDEGISNQEEFWDWLNKIRDLSETDKRFALLFEKNN